MNLFKNPKKLSAVVMAGSFFCMAGLILFTNPLQNLSYAMFFFLAFSIFLISTGFHVTLLVKGSLSQKMKPRIIVLGIFVTVLLMFKSAGALGLIDAVVLCAVAAGALFYFGRRHK